MKRPTLLWLAAILIIGLAITGWLALPALRLRQQLNYWTHSHKWESPELTQFEAWERQAEGLRRLGLQAGPLLAKDLIHGAGGLAQKIERFRQKGPAWLRPPPPKPGVDPRQLHIFETERPRAAGERGERSGGRPPPTGERFEF